MIDKTVHSAAAALAGVKDGAVVLVGGFAGAGEPRHLLEALLEHGAKDLTIVAIHAGMQDDGIGRLVAAGRVRRAIVSWARSPAGPIPLQALLHEGKAELELVPQGTLAERIHAAGAGVPAFFTATSVGTPLAHGKEHREIDGRTYVLEKAIFADVALIEAWQADRWGNLTYRRAGRNLNPVMAAAAKLTIAQAQHLVALGTIDPDHITTPGIYVQRVVHIPYGDPPL
ncbi:MAG: 3-oxoacid CoA-transferase subunit A [Acetobacteraceae bacterium]|nr:3-oxoacid CoA-transferase subunit A [Acetobacteraceae bacterium]